MNYSLLVMESVGMMNMATGDGSPSSRVPKQGPDWFLVATEACGGGTPDLFCFLEVSLFIGFFGVGLTSGGSPGCPRGRGPRPGGGCAPHPRGQPGTLLVQLRYSVGFFWSKNKFVKFQVNWTPFDFPFLRYSKTRKKTETGIGL